MAFILPHGENTHTASPRTNFNTVEIVLFSPRDNILWYIKRKQIRWRKTIYVRYLLFFFFLPLFFFPYEYNIILRIVRYVVVYKKKKKMSRTSGKKKQLFYTLFFNSFTWLIFFFSNLFIFLLTIFVSNVSVKRLCNEYDSYDKFIKSYREIEFWGRLKLSRTFF